MKKIICFSSVLICLSQVMIAQTTTLTAQNTLIHTNPNYGLTNPVYDDGSPMTYDPSQVEAKGAAFILNYTNSGGTAFDGYPSGTVGGYKAGSTYYPGNVESSGMPVKIEDLTDQLRINWKTSQANANDEDDKWWATINVIFDGDADANSRPDPEARDYDLVIQNVSYEQDDFQDFDNPGGRYWYFAREGNGDIKPFTVYLDGVAYSWAVRYKFFDFPEGDEQFHKNDKVHIKFIPMDNSKPIPYLDHSLKQFIDCTRNYIADLPLSNEELALANQKVAESSLWIKSISAGYEIYEGSSILANDYFYTTIDAVSPDALSNLLATEQSGKINLTWDLSTDQAFDTYSVYRSTNGDAYILIASNLRMNSFTDNDISNQNYRYYVTATDRSFNESAPSNIETVNRSTADIQVSVLSPIEDAHVRDGSFATSNYGTAQNLQVRESSNPEANRQAFLKFDLSSLSSIVSAKLRIYNSGNAGDIELLKVLNDTWLENDITWNTKPTSADALGTYVMTSNDTYDLDVTDYILSEFEDDKLASFMLRGSTSNFLTISSKEGSFAPELIVEYDSSQTLAVIGNSLQQDVTMYPNPTHSRLTIQIKNPDLVTGSISVFDTVGRKIFQSPIASSKMSLNLEGAAGLYIVKIFNHGAQLTTKILKR